MSGWPAGIALVVIVGSFGFGIGTVVGRAIHLADHREGHITDRTACPDWCYRRWLRAHANRRRTPR